MYTSYLYTRVERESATLTAVHARALGADVERANVVWRRKSGARY